MLFSTFYYLRYCVTDLLTTQLTGSTELSYASNLHSTFSFVYVSRTFLRISCHFCRQINSAMQQQYLTLLVGILKLVD